MWLIRGDEEELKRYNSITLIADGNWSKRSISVHLSFKKPSYSQYPTGLDMINKQEFVADTNMLMWKSLILLSAKTDTYLLT